jgi:hypothetical protein
MRPEFIDALLEIPEVIAFRGDWVPTQEGMELIRHRDRIPEELIIPIQRGTAQRVGTASDIEAIVERMDDGGDVDGEVWLEDDLLDIDFLGIAAIACYVSFHVSRPRWGIWIHSGRLASFARSSLLSTGLSSQEQKRAATEFVIDHELFHYWVDVAASKLEFSHRVPVYLPYLRMHSDLSSAVCQREEALANRRAWGRSPAGTIRRAFEASMRCQPIGYRDWVDYRSDVGHREGKRTLVREVAECAATISALSPGGPFEWFLDERRGGAGKDLVPVYLVGRRSGRPYYHAHARAIEVAEDAAFLKLLNKQPKAVLERWQEVKEGLRKGNWGGSKFGPLKGGKNKDLYRCKVGRDHRVIFRRTAPDYFLAEWIGSRGAAYTAL